MRILHFADLHIGVESYGTVDPDSGLSSRLLDFLDTYDQMVDYAIEQQVDLVLFAGDAYKSRDPSQTHQREFAKRIARLSTHGIPVFLLVGNHDIPHVIGRATALEIFQTLDVPNVYIGDGLRTYRIDTRSGPIQIVAVPWVRRGGFLARDDTRGLSPEQVNEAIQRSLARAVQLQAEALDSQVPAVLTGHVSVGEARTGSEQSMMIGHDHVLLKSDVALPQFDYVALGHIHRHQVLGRDPLVVYAGSSQRVDFGEEADDKGFCVVDLDPSLPAGSRLVKFSFEQLDARRFVTVSATVPEGSLDPTEFVLAAIEKEDVAGAIVRVRITTPAELEGYLRETDIREALSPAHYVASISREIVDRPRARLGEAYGEAPDPRDALKAYLGDRGVPAERARLLMQHAEQLMAEQDP